MSKKIPETSTQRKAKEREEKHRLGLIRFEAWINPEWKAAIKQFIEELARKS